MKTKTLIVRAMVIMVILLFSTAAADANTWEEYGVQIKLIEQKYGNFEHWPTQEKLDLVHALVGMGYIAESSSIQKLRSSTLNEDEASALADEVLASLTQRSVSDISLIEITQSIWGSYDGWTTEHKAWWQDIQNMDGVNSPDAVIMKAPESDDITEEDAINIAIKSNVEVFELPSDYFSEGWQVITEFYTTASRPDYRRWYVALERVREGDANKPSIHFAVVDAKTGDVIADPDRAIVLPGEWKDSFVATQDHFNIPLYELTKELHDQSGGLDLPERTLVQKEEYSQKVRPIIQAMLEKDDYSAFTFEGEVEYDLIVTAYYTYGLPEEDDILQTQAYEKARNVIVDQWNLDEYTISLYEASQYFDITNIDMPMWRFVFLPDTMNDVNAKYGNAFLELPRYRVEVDARTGDIISSEEFEYVPMSYKDFENELKYY